MAPQTSKYQRSPSSHRFPKAKRKSHQSIQNFHPSSRRTQTVRLMPTARILPFLTTRARRQLRLRRLEILNCLQCGRSIKPVRLSSHRREFLSPLSRLLSTKFSRRRWWASSPKRILMETLQRHRSVQAAATQAWTLVTVTLKTQFGTLSEKLKTVMQKQVLIIERR